MNMIGHQTTGPDINLPGLTPLSHQLQVRLIIFFIKKSLLSPVASLGYMMGNPGATALAMRAITLLDQAYSLYQ